MLFLVSAIIVAARMSSWSRSSNAASLLVQWCFRYVSGASLISVAGGSCNANHVGMRAGIYVSVALVKKDEITWRSSASARNALMARSVENAHYLLHTCRFACVERATGLRCGAKNTFPR